MDLILFAAPASLCARCGKPVRHVTVSARAYVVDDAPVHGLTERFDSAGRVVAYDHVSTWPGHTCLLGQ